MVGIQKLSPLHHSGAKTFLAGGHVRGPNARFTSFNDHSALTRVYTHMQHALPVNSSKRLMLADPRDLGILIAFEGLDGTGKTTQRKLFKRWLRKDYADVVITKWNSSPLFKPLIKAKKAARLLDPTSYAILHAADFWQRFETVIQPSLAGGKIVLADRYVFTGIARDAARGVDPRWGRSLYAGARKPDLVFYFDAPVRTCATRIAATRQIKFYESGQDVTGLEDSCESYLRFGETVAKEYDRLRAQFEFVVVDAQLPIYEQHRFIREIYMSRFAELPAKSALEPQLHAFLSEVDV